MFAQFLFAYESISGGGDESAGFDLSFGSGINSLLSFGGRIILPCFQSSLACSILSFEMKRVSGLSMPAIPHMIIYLCIAREALLPHHPKPLPDLLHRVQAERPLKNIRSTCFSL